MILWAAAVAPRAGRVNVPNVPPHRPGRGARSDGGRRSPVELPGATPRWWNAPARDKILCGNSSLHPNCSRRPLVSEPPGKFCLRKVGTCLPVAELAYRCLRQVRTCLQVAVDCNIIFVFFSIDLLSVGSCAMGGDRLGQTRVCLAPPTAAPPIRGCGELDGPPPAPRLGGGCGGGGGRRGREVRR